MKTDLFLPKTKRNLSNFRYSQVLIVLLGITTLLLSGMQPIYAQGDCFSALPISCNTAIIDQITENDVTFTVDNCGFPGQYPGRWFTFTGTGFDITVATCGSNTNFDTVMDVYSGNCDGLLVLEGCNDDNCGLQSAVSFCTTEAVTYYVFVSGYSGSLGTFGLSLYCSTNTCGSEGNNIADDCPDALPIYPDLFVYFSTVDATESSFPNAELCTEELFYYDVWYAYYNESPANVTLQLCTDFGDGKGTFSFISLMSVYESCPTQNNTAIACLEGSNGLGEGCLYGGELTFEGACNTTYYIRVGGIDFGNGDGELLVTTQPINPVPLVVNAGAGANITLGNSTTLGGTPTATGGFGSYTYLWDNAGTLNNATIANPLATPTGTSTLYTVTVTDVCGTTGTASVLITATPSCQTFTAFATPNNPSCGNGLGSITVTAQGGTGAYTYNWGEQPGTGDNPRTGLPSGGYTVVVTDQNNCTATAGAEITVPQLLTASITSTNPSGCSSTANNASATVQISGGETPYFIEWSGPAGFSSDQTTINNLQPGTYSVTVYDANECMATPQSVTINAPQQLSCSASGTNVTCFGQANGTATANIQGGTSPYTYTWTGSNGYTGSGQTITGLAPGTYNVTISDATGCSCASVVESIGASVAIEEPALFQVVSGGVVNDEEGDSFVIPTFFNLHTIVLAGGTFPYQFNWHIQGYVIYNISYQLVDTNGDGTPDTPGAIINIVYTDNAFWELDTNDSSGCGGEEGLQISNNPLQVLDIDSYSILPAGPGGGGSISLVVAGGVPCPGGTYNYQWAGPSNWPGSSNGPTATGLPSGWYVVTVTDCHTPTPNSTIGWFWVPKLVRGRGKIADADALSVYPNPATGQVAFTFSTTQSGQATLSLYSLDGRQVAQLYQANTLANTPQTIFYQTASLPSGIYMAALHTAGGDVYKQKMVIIH